MTPARPLAASVAALGIVGVFGVPVPATAAPAPCDRPERYAAQSGAELFRLNKLTLTPIGDADPQSPSGPGWSRLPGEGHAADNRKQPGDGASPAAGGAGRSDQGGAGRSDQGSSAVRSGAKDGTGAAGARSGATDGAGEAGAGSGITDGTRETGARSGATDGTGPAGTRSRTTDGAGEARARSGAKDGTRPRAANSAGSAASERGGLSSVRTREGGRAATGAGSGSTAASKEAAKRTEVGGKSPAEPDGAGLVGTLNGLGEATGLTGGPDRPGPNDDAPEAPRPDDPRTKTGSGERDGAESPQPDGSGKPPQPTRSAADGDVAATSDSAERPSTTPTGSTVGDVRVGEAKSALVAEAAPNSAAVARMVNGTGEPGLNEPLVQQAPPTNPEPTRRDTPATVTGPVELDGGTLTGHAQWEPGMACGVAHGRVTRAMATLSAARVMGMGGDVLVAVPGTFESMSTTALERRGEGARTVAAATIGARAFELLNGAVTVKVVRPPTLETRMSTLDGGEVSYVPAALEVSGDGIEPTTLDTAGDMVELTIGERERPRVESGSVPAIGGLGSAPPLPLPSVPGLPPVSVPEQEAAPAAGPGTHVRISLGDVRQAALGHSVAARTGAVRIAIDDAGPEGYAGGATLLDMEMGVLESAAVAPEPGGAGVSGGTAGAVSGGGGGLPLTGPRVDLLALAGVVLLVVGGAAMVFGVRKRRFRA